MKVFALGFVISVVVFLGLDVVWLTTAYEPLYLPLMGPLLKPQPDFVAAGLFYLLYLAGLNYLVIFPVMTKGSSVTGGAKMSELALKSAAFGLVAYATYDMTALAVIKDWSLTLTVIDMVWGTFVTCATATVTGLLLKVFRVVR